MMSHSVKSLYDPTFKCDADLWRYGMPLAGLCKDPRHMYGFLTSNLWLFRLTALSNPSSRPFFLFILRKMFSLPRWSDMFSAHESTLQGWPFSSYIIFPFVPRHLFAELCLSVKSILSFRFHSFLWCHNVQRLTLVRKYARHFFPCKEAFLVNFFHSFHRPDISRLVPFHHKSFNSTINEPEYWLYSQ